MTAATAKTDWSRYYSSRGIVPSVTRSFTWRKLRATLRPAAPSAPFVVTELGGADSTFYAPLATEFPVSRYRVVDNNQVGLDILARRFSSRLGATLFIHNADVRFDRPTGDDLADLCFSVGLIEHFDEDETARVIAAHFACVRENGLVLLTFPHPTWLYRVLRRGMERLGVWRFPDERPLSFEEVKRTCFRYGRVLHEDINWGCCLTQGIVLVRKSTAAVIP